MSDSRTKNTSRNIMTGLIYKIIAIVLPFINRTVLLNCLGAEFTGLSSLFTSILEILNIANLGFNTSIVYCMYKPMAENNESELCYYLTIYKKIYSIVGVVFFVGGVCFMPILPYLIGGSYPEQINLYILYLLYLINSSIGYFLFAYKESLLLADQRKDITNSIRMLVDTVRYLTQFVILILTRNYYLYVILQICGTAISNLLIQKSTLKRYPNIRYIKNQKLRIPHDLKQQTGALLIERICDTFRNSFDNIIISAYLGLVVTSIYGNYYYIYSAVYSIMLIICGSMSASIGNSIARENTEKNYKDMRTFQFIYAFLNSTATICMVALYQPFMRIWVGNSLMLSDGNMLLFCLYFYLINMCNIRNQYINGTGMWWHLKLNYVLEALANLGLNLLLGKLMGVTGIILATIITIFFFNYVLRTHKLFKIYFNKGGETRFNIDQLQYFFITLLLAMLVYIAEKQLDFHGIIGLVLYGLLAVVLTSIFYIIAFYNTDRASNAIILFNRVVKKRRNK